LSRSGWDDDAWHRPQSADHDRRHRRGCWLQSWGADGGCADSWQHACWPRPHRLGSMQSDRLARECPPVPKAALVCEHVARPRAQLFCRHRRRPRAPALHPDPGALQRCQVLRPSRAADATPILAAGTRNSRPKSWIKPVRIALPSLPAHGHFYHGTERQSVLVEKVALLTPSTTRVGVRSCLRILDAPRTGVFAQTMG
jgi:hypothetical protein